MFRSFRTIVGGKIAPAAFARAEEEQGAHLDSICDEGSSHLVFVAIQVDGGEIVGFCAVSLDSTSKLGEIDLNAVDPDHQGRGIGSKMYEHALALMRQAGMRVATVGTGGDPSHAAARRAYRKAGFTAEIPSFYMYRPL